MRQYLQSPIRSPLRLGVRGTLARALRPRLAAKRVELRTLGREHGVAWLRATLQRFSVEALADLPESAVDRLIGELAGA